MAVGTPMAIEDVSPAVTDVLFAFGLIFIGGDTVDHAAIFNRFDFGSPWGLYGSYVSAYPGPVSVFTTPDASGQPLSACNAEGG